jgi:hypothetical protein
MEIYYFSPQTLFYWTVAYSIYEWIAIYLIIEISRINNHKTPIRYYSILPSWVPVSGDFIYTTIILITAQILFTQFESKLDEYIKSKLLAFIVILVLVQWTFDLLFAYIVMSVPSGFSKYVSFFQSYIKEVGYGAALADSIWIVGWLLLTLLCIKYVPISVGTLIIFLSLFIWLVVKW